MGEKKGNLVLLLTAAVIVVAVISSFGMGLFTQETARIVLPTPAATQGPSDGPEEADVVRIEVTAQTVQNVIRTLSRPESYYREVAVEDIWGAGEAERGSTRAQVWVDGGWTMTYALGTGTPRWSIVGDGTLWLWYEDSQEVYSAPADEYSADLEGQRIPTYEDVLALDTGHISDAGYMEQGGMPCIYVETAPDQLEYWERYWVAVDSGLLVCAETLKGERVVYRMSAYDVERPAPEGTRFALPDGTVLHAPGETTPTPEPTGGPE